MANVKAAIKMMRVSARKRSYNKPIRSGIKSRIAKAERLVQLGDVENAKPAVLEVFSAVDKAALKGVIHPNAASRYKSRLMKKLNAAQSASA